MGNVNMEASQINFRGGDKKMSVETALKNVSGEAAAIAQLQEDVANLNGSKANKVDIATEFSDLANYNAGDLVYYEGSLYEFQVDHTAGTWETSEVIQKDLSDIITMLKSGLTNKTETITTGLFSGLLVMRCANIETISGEYVTAGQALSANTWVTIATVSSDYRPSADRYLSAYICGANGALLASARLNVKANGEISLCPSANIASGTAVFFVVTFVI